jgi:hypothetical protein
VVPHFGAPMIKKSGCFLMTTGRGLVAVCQAIFKRIFRRCAAIIVPLNAILDNLFYAGLIKLHFTKNHSFM